MNEKQTPEEILNGFVQDPENPEIENIFPIEAEAEADEIAVEDILAEVLSEDEESPEMEFDLDAFLPDEPEEPAEAAEGPAEEPILSSGYMDNYPVLPDSVETPEPAVKNAEFEDDGEFEENFNKKMPEMRKSEKERPVRKGRPKRPKGYGLLGIPQKPCMGAPAGATALSDHHPAGGRPH